MKNNELIARCIAHPRLTPLLTLLVGPLLVNLSAPSNVSVLLRIAKMAPPCTAELLLKLLVRVKLNEMLVDALIAPPLSCDELLLKLLFPMNVNEMLVCTRNATPCKPAELLMKLLVPLKVSALFLNAQIAPLL